MRRLRIVVGDCWAEVSGRGGRDLLTELAGRPPAYLARSRAWSTTPQRARDLAALAELRGYAVTVTGADAERLSLDDRVTGFRDPGEGRW